MARFAVDALSIAAAIVTLATRAEADQAPARARADALFNDARAKMAHGDYAGACPELAESESLDPAVGTMMNLAMCHEQIGQTATAARLWKDAARLADERGQVERATASRDRAAALEPTLPRVHVDLATPTAGQPFRVSIDGLAVTDLGAATPVDPGAHDLLVTVAGRRPWSTRFGAKPGQLTALLVPPLEPESGAADPPSGALPATRPLPSRESPWTSRSPVPWVVAGVGVAGLGVSAAFGIAALASKQSAYHDNNCVQRTVLNCNPAAMADIDRARSQATVSDVSLAIGSGALLAAVVVWAVGAQRTAPPALLSVEPAVSRESWSVAVSRQW